MKVTKYTKAADDMNKVMGLEPAIDTALEQDALIASIKKNATEVQEKDKLADSTWKVLAELKVGPRSTPAPAEEAAPAKPAKAAKPAKEAKTPKAKAEKPAKAAKAPKAPKEPKGPGVIASIVEFLGKGPITKEAIVKLLAKRFPNRDAEGMAKTVNVQLPNRIAREQGIKVVVTDEGYALKK